MAQTIPLVMLMPTFIPLHFGNYHFCPRYPVFFYGHLTITLLGYAMLVKFVLFGGGFVKRRGVFVS